MFLIQTSAEILSFFLGGGRGWFFFKISENKIVPVCSENKHRFLELIFT